MWILRLTDLEPFETSHEMIPVDVSDPDAVIRTAEGMDAIVNLSVLRPHRQIAFDVNTMGCYNMMRAAVAHGIRRVINTGPHFTVQGAPYERWDYHLGPEGAAETEYEFVCVVEGIGAGGGSKFYGALRCVCAVLPILHFSQTR